MAERDAAFKLTFTGSMAEIAALQQGLIARAYSEGAGEWKRFTDRYFDTPDEMLFRTGASLCLREEEGRLVQIQTASNSGQMPFVHHTVETILADRAEFPKAPVCAGDDGLEYPNHSLNALLAHIVADCWATRLRFGRSIIEMAILLGHGKSGPGFEKQPQVPLSEVTLTLIDGRPKDLIGLARLMARNGTLRLSCQSPLETVLAGQKGGIFHIPRATKILASGTEPVGQILQRALANLATRLAVLQGPLVDGRRSKAVQQMRVAMRRLRATERIFRPHLKTGQIRDLAASAKLFARILAKARDWDVFVDETLSTSLESDYAPVGSRDLKIRAQAKRAEGWMRASATVSDPAFTQFLIDIVEASVLAQWRKPARRIFALSVSEFAPKVLNRSLKKARKTAGLLRPGHHADLHQLRIALKKLRYPVQMFRHAYTKEQRQTYMAALSRLQHHFGIVNDAMVAQRLADEAAKGGGDEAMRVAGFVCGYKSAQAEAAAKKIEADWAVFEAMAPFWHP